MDSTEQQQRINILLDKVRDELNRAMSKHDPIRSPHEGYAVILEEVDELWDEVKAQLYYPPSAYKEALQIAAMAIRFIVDLDKSLGS